MERHETPLSQSATSDTEEAPLPFRSSPPHIDDDGRSRRSVALSESDPQHQLLFFNSGRRVNSEVEEAYKEDNEGIFGVDKLKRSWSDVWQSIRPGFILNHLDWNSFKIVSRTWAALFFGLILMVVTRTNNYLGNASYLTMILAGIEAAGGISFSQAFYTSLVDLCFALFAFMTSVISHAISWRIRGYPTVPELMKELSDEGICKLTDQACFMHEIHKGRYLTTKTTVISLFGMIFSLFITGLAAQKTRLLLIPYILSAITACITGVYLNMTPQFTPWTYGRAVILPFGLALSARFVLSLFWFPVSSNYKFFSIVSNGMTAASNILKDNIAQLETLRPSSDDYGPLVAKVGETIDNSLAKFALLELEGLLCRGEVCFSRFDPGDLGEFRSLTRLLVGSLIGFRFFFDEVLEKRNAIITHLYHMAADSDSLGEKDSEALAANIAPKHENSEHSKFKKFQPRKKSVQEPLVPIHRRDTLSTSDHLKKNPKWFNSRLTHIYAPAGNFEDERFDAAQEYAWDNMSMEDLDDLYPLIIMHYKPIGEAIVELLTAVTAWSTAANKFRLFQWLYPPSRQKHQKLQAENSKRVQQALEALTRANEEKDTKYAEWAETYNANHISRSTMHYVNVLAIDSFHSCTIRQVVRSAVKLGGYCIFLDNQQPTPGIVYPFMKLRSKSPRFESEYLMSAALGPDGGGDGAFMPYEPQKGHVQRRNPDSTPPRNYYHLVGRQIQNFFSIVKNPQVQFALKRAIISMTPNLMYCTRTTIFFSYSYRTVWIAIMTALTISFQALDGVYGFIAKLGFTIIGCVTGLVVWYIGSGSGRGNSFGIAAAFGVVMVVMTFFRHFNGNKIPMGAIILCVTTTIVVGTSWNVSKMSLQDVKLGWGWHLAWIRFVCVVIGLTIAFIGTILPKPVTAKKNIRVMLSGCLEQFGEIQTNVSNFGLQRELDAKVHIAPRQDINRMKLRRLAMTVVTAKQLAGRLDYEPPLAGLWPKHRYLLLLKLISELSHVMGSVYILLDNVEDTSHIPFILHAMGWTNVELVSSMYSVLILASRALAMGTPLPSVTPGHLSEIYSHILKERLYYDIMKEDRELKNLIKGRYMKHDGRLTLALIILMNMMYTRVDGCLRLIKGLVGEIYGVDLKIFDYDFEAAGPLPIFGEDL